MIKLKRKEINLKNMKEKNNLRSRDWDHTMESKSKKNHETQSPINSMLKDKI
jgi:hypothetical protein